MAKVVYVVGNDVSTDVIYPGRYMATVLPSETPQFAFADDAAFHAKLEITGVPAGSFLVAGHNFGCGSSREQAVSCLKGHDLVIVARSFARIFLQNSINLGLRTIICPTLEAQLDDELQLQPTHVANLTKGRAFPSCLLSPARQAIVDAGGLIPYTRQRLVASAAP